MIPWAEIRRRGEEGRLTAIQTDALVEMAQSAYRWELGGKCHYCPVTVWAVQSGEEGHAPECPIRVLEEIELGNSQNVTGSVTKREQLKHVQRVKVDGDWKDVFEMQA